VGEDWSDLMPKYCNTEVRAARGQRSLMATFSNKGSEMITFGQGLSKGVYQVTITTSNGKTFVERWVKQ
jgi:hypothetical protein